MKIIFKNLEKSKLTSHVVKERLEVLHRKFPSLNPRDIECTLEMHNSLTHEGPNYFTVKVQIKRGSYQGVILEKSASNIYVALANVIERMHERLRRFDEKSRTISRQYKLLKRKLIVQSQLLDQFDDDFELQQEQY